MSLIAGSYERFVWGSKLKSQTLVPLFSYPSHTSPIISVAASGPAAASGGADDTIHLYDLSSASSLGSLTDGSASVTSLAFYAPPGLSFPRNLLSAAADGSVSIYDADPFVHLQTLFVHKKAVNDLAVHRSGKVALTVGRDECLAMVNLVRGRRSFYCRLGKEATLVEYGLGGERFFMVMGEKVGVHDAEDARLVCELEGQKKILCAAPGGQDGLLFTGGEDKNVTAWDTNSGKVAYNIEGAHSTRLKGIVVLTKNNSSTDDVNPFLVASASSDGVIRVWDVRVNDPKNPLAETNTKSRLTCLAGSSLRSSKVQQTGNKLVREDAETKEPGATSLLTCCFQFVKIRIIFDSACSSRKRSLSSVSGFSIQTLILIHSLPELAGQSYADHLFGRLENGCDAEALIRVVLVSLQQL